MSTNITMSTTLKKTFTDFSAEEAWLNEMSAKGQALVAYRGMSGYTFVAAEPGAWQYAIEILDGKGTTRDNYLSFLKDVGIEVVSIYACRAYLRKKNDGVPFELHSDLKSRLEQAQKGNIPWTSIPLSQVVLALILITSVLAKCQSLQMLRRASLSVWQSFLLLWLLLNSLFMASLIAVVFVSLNKQS